MSSPVSPPSSPSPPSPTGGALVPVKEENIQFTAGVIGGAVGFTLAGPLGGAIAAGFTNYVSRQKDDEVIGEVFTNLSKTTLEVVNYVNALNEKYTVLNKAQSALEASYDKLKGQEKVDTESLAKVEKALSDTRGKITEINDEYDIVGAGFQALGIVGDVTEKAVKKSIELNEEYKITDKGIEAVKVLVDKVQEKVKEKM